MSGGIRVRSRVIRGDMWASGAAFCGRVCAGKQECVQEQASADEDHARGIAVIQNGERPVDKESPLNVTRERILLRSHIR